MDVYLLCIGIEGVDDRVAWSVMIVEPEGFVEEISGLASSQERAMLWALKEGLYNAPSKSNIAIRSTCTPLIRFGEHTLSHLTFDDAQEDQDHDLLVPIVKRMKNQQLVWMNPPYLEPGDSRAQKLAKDIIQDPYSAYPPEEIDYITTQYRLESQTLPEEEKSLSSSLTHSESELSEESLSEDNFSEEDISEEINIENREEEPSQELDLQSNEQGTDIATAISEPSANSIDDVYEAPVTSSEPQINETENEEPSQESSPLPVEETPPILIPQIKKPQLVIEESPDYLFGSRILAYIDGVGTGNLGAWAFVLIDKKTGSALVRASGLRASNPYRSRLLACIEVLSAIKAISQEIEIRSRWQNIIKLGDQWMHSWKAKNWSKSGNEPIQELGFIQQLYAMSTQHRVRWQYIPDHNEEHGIQLCKKHVQEALSHINAGHKGIYNERIKNFPMDKLL